MRVKDGDMSADVDVAISAAQSSTVHAHFTYPLLVLSLTVGSAASAFTVSMPSTTCSNSHNEFFGSLRRMRQCHHAAGVALSVALDCQRHQACSKRRNAWTSEMKMVRQEFMVICQTTQIVARLADDEVGDIQGRRGVQRDGECGSVWLLAQSLLHLLSSAISKP